MIIGVGIDRIAIARVRNALVRFGARFEARVFTETERAQARAKGDPARRFAMLFAAKEAAAKALGTGFRQGVGPKQIETIHLPTGRPVMRLHGAARRHAERIGARSVLVSLTDDEGVAMAFAVAVTHDAG